MFWVKLCLWGRVELVERRAELRKAGAMEAADTNFFSDFLLTFFSFLQFVELCLLKTSPPWHNHSDSLTLIHWFTDSLTIGVAARCKVQSFLCPVPTYWCIISGVFVSSRISIFHQQYYGLTVWLSDGLSVWHFPKCTVRELKHFNLRRQNIMTLMPWAPGRIHKHQAWQNKTILLYNSKKRTQNVLTLKMY